MSIFSVRDLDGVALVTMDRPPANAIDPAFIESGLEMLDGLGASVPDAVVLTGTNRFFSAGADLRAVPALEPSEQAEMARRINALFAGWFAFARPVVTAVNGHAVAGGLVLALCGDARVGPTTGRFGLTEVAAGIPFPSAAMAVVRSELPMPALRRLTLRAELVDAPAAAALGIFDEAVADDMVVDRGVALAREMGALPANAYGVVKAQLRAAALEVERGRFGGAEAVEWVTSESGSAAGRILNPD
ncbi:MAG TPA: enoyl-CoA hydratase/isomerase family protein [Acidimicrobiia bacterium]|nr:enoyl-CoA hydratase/isomerase family protein [Acidimicrobiia bacterium]